MIRMRWFVTVSRVSRHDRVSSRWGPAAGQSSLRGMHEVFGACPLDCPDGCSWVVTVDDEGRAINLRGNREHPFTAGALCAKVNGYLDHTRAADRILHPLKRVGR